MADREMFGAGLFFGAIVATVLLVGAGIYASARMHAETLATRRIEERQIARQAAVEAGRFVVDWTAPGTPAPVEPDDPAWDGIAARTIALDPQQITMPRVTELAVPEIDVQAVTDGESISWRLSWSDASADENVDTGRFCDAVALQFALDPAVPYTMGGRHKPVEIIEWKALWQKDVDVHFQDVQDLHPTYWTDLYWFAEGEFPYPVPAAFSRPESLLWFPAYRAGNPVADIHRDRVVEEFIAEGYGTLTPQTRTDATGRGRWRDGRWAVVVRRPMRTGDRADVAFYPRTRGVFAVAVWDGSAGNVGGRKQISGWNDFEVLP